MTDNDIVQLPQSNPEDMIPELDFSNVPVPTRTNRNYHAYYLPTLYQDNYRMKTAEDLEALPVGTIIVGLFGGGADAYKRIGNRWAHGVYSYTHSEMFDSGEKYWVVYRPDTITGREGLG